MIYIYRYIYIYTHITLANFVRQGSPSVLHRAPGRAPEHKEQSDAVWCSDSLVIRR